MSHSKELSSFLRYRERTVDENAELYGELNRFTKRRSLLRLAVGAGLSLPFTTLATAAVKPPRKMRPQTGDIIVYRFGEQQGQPIRPEHIPPSTGMIQAVAMEPKSHIIRARWITSEWSVARPSPGRAIEPTDPCLGGEWHHRVFVSL